MQELVYHHGIHGCFNHNIEILRDIAEVVGLSYMVNSYDNISWAITEYGRVVVMITNRRSVDGAFRTAVLVEFQGDGCCTIYGCDAYGNADEYNYLPTRFDIHSCIGGGKDAANKKFKEILKSKYDVWY